MDGGRAGYRARAPLHGPIGRRHAHDSRVHDAVKTALESEQTRELQGVPQPELKRVAAAFSYRRRRMVHQDLDRPSPTRFAIEQAMFRGRCGIKCDSYTAPRADTRAR